MNIIKNAGFESGRLSSGWRQTPGSATLDGGVTDATSHSGDYCLELRAIDFVEQAFFIAQATGNLSFYAKVESVVTAGPFYVRIEYMDGSENTHFVRPSTRWDEFSYWVDDSKRLSRIQFGTGETGSVYIDDVYLDGSRRDPFIPEFRDPRLDDLLGFPFHWPFPWRGHPFYPRWFMSPPEMMEEQAMFEYGSVMEDRLAQLETQLTELTAMLSKRDTGPRPGAPTKSKVAAKKSSQKVVAKKRKKTKKT